MLERKNRNQIAASGFSVYFKNRRWAAAFAKVVGRRARAEQARENFAERMPDHLGGLHLQHFGGAQVTANNLHLVVIDQNAFANRVKGLLPDPLAALRAFFAFAQ